MASEMGDMTLAQPASQDVVPLVGQVAPSVHAERMAIVNAQYLDAEKARQAERKRALRPSYLTTEGILAIFGVVGGFGVVFQTLADGAEKLAKLFPEYGALPAAALVLAGLATAATAIGALAKSRAAVKAGRMMALALALGLTLTSTSAMAADRAAWEPERVASLTPEPPSLADLVDLGVGPSADLHAGRWSLGLTVLGTIALAEPRAEWMLLAAMGGSLLAPLDAGLPGASAKAGALVQFPGVRGGLKASLGAGASYFLAGDAPPNGRWGFWTALVFHAL